MEDQKQDFSLHMSDRLLPLFTINNDESPLPMRNLTFLGFAFGEAPDIPVPRLRLSIVL